MKPKLCVVLSINLAFRKSGKKKEHGKRKMKSHLRFSTGHVRERANMWNKVLGSDESKIDLKN